MLGVVYTLLAAASFGINNATLRRGVITGTVSQVVLISMPIGLAMFVLAAAALGQIGDIARFSRASLWLLASAGVVHFVIGRYCSYRSVQAMGANLSAPVTQWSLLVTLVLAVIFLHERLDVLKMTGIGLLVSGPALIIATQRVRARRTQTKARPLAATKFKPRLVEGYTFGILGCIAWGSSPILVRAALEGTPFPLAGGVVSYTAATLAVAIVMLLPMARRDARGIDRRNFVWFIWTGITVCISQIFLYMAMAIAPVTVVQPLMRFSNILSTLFSWLLNREYEVFEPSVLAAIGVSLVGAVALGVDSGSLMLWIDAPAWMAQALTWTWP